MALSLFIAMVCLRMPSLLHGGRFWAEEGTIYFLHAWTMPWWHALFLPANGYLSLAANAAGILACHLASLQTAPYVTMATALAIQALPAAMLATAHDDWLQRPEILFPAMFLLGMPPACDEVWLNTANSQFHLEVAAALCLVLETPSGAWAVLRGCLIFLTPLCSPGSIALAPLFVLRAALDRQNARLIDAALMLAGSAIQLLTFYSPIPGRGHSLSFTLLALIFSVKHVAIPLLGEREASRVAAAVRREFITGKLPLTGILVAIVSVCSASVAVILRRRSQPFWLFVCGGALAVFSYDGALGKGPDLIALIGSRYAFAPSVLFSLGILSLAATAGSLDDVAGAAWVVVIWMVAISVQQTLSPQEPFFATGPSWKAELAIWQNDHDHPLKIWPTGWVVRLPPYSP